MIGPTSNELVGVSTDLYNTLTTSSDAVYEIESTIYMSVLDFLNGHDFN